MNATSIFYLIIGILVVDFLLERFLGLLNYTWYSKAIPKELSDVYEPKEYKKSQEYKKTNFRFSLISSTLSFLVIILFLHFKGFALVDQIARGFATDQILVALLFFGLSPLSSVLSADKCC